MLTEISFLRKQDPIDLQGDLSVKTCGNSRTPGYTHTQVRTDIQNKNFNKFLTTK